MISRDIDDLEKFCSRARSLDKERHNLIGLRCHAFSEMEHRLNDLKKFVDKAEPFLKVASTEARFGVKLAISKIELTKEFIKAISPIMAKYRKLSSSSEEEW